MIPDKKVRATIDSTTLQSIKESLQRYVEYSIEKGYQHSIDRAKPVLDYVEKKVASTKEERISIQISFADIGTIHDSLTDNVLYYENSQITPILTAIEWVEDTFTDRMNKHKIHKRDLFTRTLLDVKRMLVKEGRLDQ